MVAIITGALILIILAAFAGWFFGTWQTRLRFKLNVEKKWNEGEHYFRYWNPWNRTKHFALISFTKCKRSNEAVLWGGFSCFTASQQPEDTKIPL